MSHIDWAAQAVAQCRRLNPYVPGKPIERLLTEKGLRDAIKLGSNENPYGPPPKVLQAVREHAHEVHRYPDGDGTKLKQALADKHDVQTANLLLGNGSNDVLELIIRTFAGPADEVIYSERGFIVYALAATAAGARGVTVPEQNGLSHDLDAMAANVSQRTKVICVANPNNPTGTLHDLTAIQSFLDRLPEALVVILDEAYHEYVADETGDAVSELKHPGLIVCRTFSKAFGLAGLRIGYAVGDATLLELVNRFRAPFNVNALAQHAALAALDQADWVMEKVAESKRERARLEAHLQDQGLLGVNSHANFVLLRHARANEILLKLEDHGIIPRPLGVYGMPDYLRISVGRPEENSRFCQVLDETLKELEP